MLAYKPLTWLRIRSGVLNAVTSVINVLGCGFNHSSFLQLLNNKVSPVAHNMIDLLDFIVISF